MRIYVYANGRYIGRLTDDVTVEEAIKALGPYVKVWRAPGLTTIEVWDWVPKRRRKQKEAR